MVKSEILTSTFPSGSFAQIPVLLNLSSKKKFGIIFTSFLDLPLYVSSTPTTYSYFYNISSINPFLFLSATKISKTPNYSHCFLQQTPWTHHRRVPVDIYFGYLDNQSNSQVVGIQLPPCLWPPETEIFHL